MQADARAAKHRGGAGASGAVVDRVLVVGLGSIGRRHARVARLVRPRLRVAAWRHRRSDEQLPVDVAEAVWSLDDALAFAPHVAVIASPASHHLDSARALADAGVHLLIEKPIASNSTGVAELIATCAQRGLVLMTGYNLRFLPSLNQFRTLLMDGVIGRILSVRAEAGQYLPDWRPDADYRQSVSARSELGGGVLLELSHEFDYLQWILGDVCWVHGHTSRQGELEIDVEDTAHAVLGFAPSRLGDGVVASLSLDFVRRDSTRTCTAIGTSGSLRWDGITGELSLFRAGASAWEVLAVYPAERDATYVAEWRAFLSAVEDGGAVPVTGQDGLAALAVVEAVRESSTSGVRVFLPAAR